MSLCEGFSGDCSVYGRVAESYEAQGDGVESLFRGFLVELIFSILAMVAAVMASWSARSPAEVAASALAAFSSVMLAGIPVATVFLYRGFSRLSEAAGGEYGIGAKGSIVSAAGAVPVLAGMAFLAVYMRELGGEVDSGTVVHEVPGDVAGLAVLLALSALVSLLGTAMIMVALWRLGSNILMGGGLVKVGVILWAAGSLLVMLGVSIGSLIGLIGTGILLYGLHIIKEFLTEKAREAWYKAKKCRAASS